MDVARACGRKKLGVCGRRMDEKNGCCTYMWMENVDVVFLETRKKQDKGRQAKKASGEDPKKEKSEAEKATVRVHECVAQ